MFEAPSGNSYGAKFYGSAAISEALGGGNWMAEGCGKCWRVTGTSNAGSIAPGVETTLVLKGTNFCPPGNAPCENGKAHFDIAGKWIMFLQPDCVYLSFPTLILARLVYHQPPDSTLLDSLYRILVIVEKQRRIRQDSRHVDVG